MLTLRNSIVRLYLTKRTFPLYFIRENVNPKPAKQTKKSEKKRENKMKKKKKKKIKYQTGLACTRNIPTLP